MADIQERVSEKNERNTLTRAFYAGSDKDAIVAWKQEFSKILQIFHVCSVDSVWSLLTVSFQTELAINTHVAITSGRREVTDIVTNMHQDVLVIKESVSGKRRMVSRACFPPTKGC